MKKIDESDITLENGIYIFNGEKPIITDDDEMTSFYDDDIEEEFRNSDMDLYDFAEYIGCTHYFNDNDTSFNEDNQPCSANGIWDYNPHTVCYYK